MKYISSKEYAAKYNWNPVYVRMLLADGAIPGVIRTGRTLLIPENTPAPEWLDGTKHEYETGCYTALSTWADANNFSRSRLKDLYNAGKLPSIIEVGGRLFVPDDLLSREEAEILKIRTFNKRPFSKSFLTILLRYPPQKLPKDISETVKYLLGKLDPVE
ncbi:MAG: hypothetical protein GXY05_13795, partial [Clostridiales bacterium]|nr:hypothetical protein [Clostridiales bacterium]